LNYTRICPEFTRSDHCIRAAAGRDTGRFLFRANAAPTNAILSLKACPYQVTLEVAPQICTVE